MRHQMTEVTEETAICVDRLSRRFGATQAVCEVSLEIPRGSVFGLLGVNGAGKSTLLKLLMGHLRPDSGTIRILDRTLEDDLMALRRRVGYVSEARYLYNNIITVSQTLWLSRCFHDNWDKAREASLLEQFELPLKKMVRQLSKGQRTRLCLVLVLCYHPEVLILDEPTSDLDPQARHEINEYLIKEVAGSGTTIIYSTHQVHDLENLADLVGIIHGGRLVRLSALDALREDVCRLSFTANGHTPDVSGLPGILDVRTEGNGQVLTVDRYGEALLHDLQSYGITEVERERMSLEDIFLATIGSLRREESVS